MHPKLRSVLPGVVCLLALASGGSRNVQAQRELPVRWVGTITVKSWSFSGTPVNASWEFTVAPRLREERVDIVHAGRTVGQLIVLKDDGSAWRGSGGGAGTDGLTRVTQGGSGSGTLRDTFAWVYRSVVADDPLADILPDGTYALSNGGSDARIRSTTTMSSPVHESVTTSDVPLAFFIGRYFPHRFQGTVEAADLRRALEQSNIQGQAVVALDTQQRRLADGRMQGTYSYRHPSPQGLMMDVSWELTRRLDLTGTLTEAPADWRPLAGTPATFTAAIDASLGVRGRFRFTLSGVSTEPGYAMNAGDGDELDLQFSADQAIAFEPATQTADGWTIETSDALTSADVSVIARDYGAWGRLSAQILVDGEWYDCLPPSRERSVSLPADANGNHIADGWERDLGLSDARASADIDSGPEGAGPGDGFTNYEEYRGFVVEGVWTSTDPTWKELFVHDTAAVGTGFFTASGVVPYLIAENEFDGDRVVNFNRRTGTAGPQKGLKLVDARLPAGTLGDILPPRVAPPNEITEVRIDKVQLRPHGQIGLASTIAHEIGHAVGVEHHGPGAEIGSCGDPAARKLVATWGGAHSGDRQCVMAYGAADFYKRADHACQPFMWPGTFGASFCTARTGTDINAGPERRDAQWDLPLPVSGDARVGDCVHQVRLKR